MKIIFPVFSWIAVAGLVTSCSHPPAKSGPTGAETPPGSLAPPAKVQALAPGTLDPAYAEVVAKLTAQASPPLEGEGWKLLFDGKTITGWRETRFAGSGGVVCERGVILLNQGDPFTGINGTNEFPKTNYEIALDAARLRGSDFFCGLTVPVGEGACSLIVGGWGGSLVGISSLDGMDASENETTSFLNFESDRWYRIRMRVTPARIEVWIDGKKHVDVDISDRRVALRPGDIEMSKPFGISSWQTTAALREIAVRPVTGPADAKRKR